MIIFPAEREVADRVRSANILAYASVAYPGPVPGEVGADSPLARVTAARTESLGQPDLFYLNSVLVSTGWNNNDDVFLTEEVWPARHSPQDKPFNFEHNQTDIIGHITGDYVIDVSGGALNDDTSPEDVPEDLHVITSAVLYTYWEKAELAERMQGILQDIPHSRWYVSMECLFAGFDYALLDKDGTTCEIIARSRRTAHLTKHLRAYGGKGEYEGRRLGRALRDIIFSGKGLVRNPANPASVIFPPEKSVGYTTPKEERMMAETMDLARENEGLRAQVEKLKASVQESDSRQWKAQVEALTASLKERDDRLSLLDGQVKAAQEETSRAQGSLADLGKQHAALSQEVQQARVELAREHAKAKHSTRVSAVAKALKMSAEKAEQFASTLATLDDPAFESVLKVQAEYMDEKCSVKKVGGVPLGGKPAPPGTVVNAKDDMEEDEAKKCDASALDRVKPQNDPALAVATSTEVDVLRADVLSFFSREAAKPRTKGE